MFILFSIIYLTIAATLIYFIFKHTILDFVESDRKWYEREREWAKYLEEQRKKEGVK